MRIGLPGGAKLELSPGGKWDDMRLQIAREDADHNQVLRGTVQHEILEGERQIAAFQDGALKSPCRRWCPPETIIYLVDVVGVKDNTT
ncbi:MAG: hypothetical protein PHX38_13540 [Sulfuricella sp.]|nr:hypothetical protein [Sulfuricella sp.]